jgi:hypothetical protein
MIRAMSLLRASSLVGAAAAFLSPGLWLGPCQDSAAYVLIAVRLREGFMPYRDVFDNKPPGTYLLNALGQIAAPFLSPWAVAWLLSVLFAGASILLVDALLRRSVGPVAAWIGSLVCCALVSGYLTAFGGGLTETYALAPLLLALWLVVARPRGLRTAAAVGALLSAACVFSLECAPAALAIAAAGVYDRGNLRTSSRSGAILALAAAVPAVLVVVWLWLGGAVGAAWDQLVPYNGAYRTSGPGPLTLVLVPLVVLGGLAIPAVTAAVRMVRNPAASDRLGWVSLAWLVGYATYLAYQGRMFPHYLIMAAPPAIFLAVRGAAPLWAAMASRRASPRQAVLATVVVSVFVLLASMAADLGLVAVQNGASLKTTSDPVTTWLRAHESSGKTLFVWGYDPVLYLNGGLAPSDRYVYIYPLVTPGYGSVERSAAVVAGWERKPPDVIVEGDSAVPYRRPMPSDSDSRSLDTLQPLRDFIAGHYLLAASIGNEDIYVLIPA